MKPLEYNIKQRPGRTHKGTVYLHNFTEQNTVASAVHFESVLCTLLSGAVSKKTTDSILCVPWPYPGQRATEAPREGRRRLVRDRVQPLGGVCSV